MQSSDEQIEVLSESLTRPRITSVVDLRELVESGPPSNAHQFSHSNDRDAFVWLRSTAKERGLKDIDVKFLDSLIRRVIKGCRMSLVSVYRLSLEAFCSRLRDLEGPESALGEQESNERHEDGPVRDSPGTIYYKGRRFSLSRRCWELICALWRRNDGVTFLELEEKIWDMKTNPATIRSAVSRLDSALNSHGILWSAKTNKERVYLE